MSVAKITVDVYESAVPGADLTGLTPDWTESADLPFTERGPLRGLAAARTQQIVGTYIRAHAMLPVTADVAQFRVAMQWIKDNSTPGSDIWKKANAALLASQQANP